MFRIQVRQLLAAKKWREPSLAVGPKIDAGIKRSIEYYRAAIVGGKSRSEPNVAELAKLQIENKTGATSN
jgi:hypothetical protein